MRKYKINCLLALIMLGMTMLTACSYRTDAQPEETVAEESEDKIVIGFSQVGAESDWRKANTISMKETFTEEKGYKLIISDAQQKQTKQITAIRTFIQQEVDYIVLAPVTEDGWDTVLQEAKDAGIPVIIIDRMVNVSDDSLYVCRVGSDFNIESGKVCNWLTQYIEYRGIEPSDINIVSIQGTLGSSSQIGRSAGLHKAVRSQGWNLLEEAEGEYTQARAREVMSSMLRKYDDINIVYCENDNEAFGAIDAIKAVGKHVGPNIQDGQILIVSFDGVSTQAIEMCRNGKISCIAECNPMQGPRVEKIIEGLEKGEQPNKYETVDEKLFTNIPVIKNVVSEGNLYPVTILD